MSGRLRTAIRQRWQVLCSEKMQVSVLCDSVTPGLTPWGPGVWAPRLGVPRGAQAVPPTAPPAPSPRAARVSSVRQLPLPLPLASGAGWCGSCLASDAPSSVLCWLEVSRGVQPVLAARASVSPSGRGRGGVVGTNNLCGYRSRVWGGPCPRGASVTRWGHHGLCRVAARSGCAAVDSVGPG